MVRHRRVREMGRERTENFHTGTWTRRWLELTFGIEEKTVSKIARLVSHVQ
jgi:hypothetical protein